MTTLEQVINQMIKEDPAFENILKEVLRRVRGGQDDTEWVLD